MFSVGPVEYCWEDVVLGANLCGQWALLERLVSEGIACGRELQARGEVLAEAEVDAEGTRLRYEKNLVSAAEAEAWLRGWGLSVEAWKDSVRRAVLRRRFSGDLPRLLTRHRVRPEEVSQHLKADGVTSGMLARFARDLAGRAAVWDSVAGRSRDPQEPRQEAHAVEQVLDALPANLRENGLAGLGPARTRERLKPLAPLEACWRRFRGERPPAAAVAALIEARRLDWTRIACHAAGFASEDAAREAALCVREDGAAFAEVCAEAGVPMRLLRLYLEDLEPLVRERLLAASPGELVGPLRQDREWVLYTLLEKRPPSAADADARSRAEQAVLDRTVEHEISARVRWRAVL